MFALHYRAYDARMFVAHWTGSDIEKIYIRQELKKRCRFTVLICAAEDKNSAACGQECQRANIRVGSQFLWVNIAFKPTLGEEIEHEKV